MSDSPVPLNLKVPLKMSLKMPSVVSISYNFKTIQDVILKVYFEWLWQCMQNVASNQ